MVYAATDLEGNGSFILKLCPLNPTAVARIKREIKILSEMNSQYFPKCHFQFFVTDEVIDYFIDSFTPKSSQDRIDELHAMQLKPFLATVEEYIEHLPWETCLPKLREEQTFLRFLKHILLAMKLLWDKKIVHRDLKPENILIRPNFEPVIIDLGIAKSLVDGASVITHPLFPSPCTPRYAAPEQLMNHKSEVTHKTDQFTLGVIAFIVLTGKHPYGNDAEIGLEGIVQNFLKEKTLRILDYNSSISEPVMSLVMRMLKVKPYQRFRSVDEMVSIIDGLMR